MSESLASLRASLAHVGRVAVLAGGNSAERNVSLRSGKAVHQALRNMGVLAEIIDPAEVSLNTLSGFQKVFIALHGRGGEDGVIQGVLEFLQIPYTGSGVMASAIGMDKIRTKMLWQTAGLPTPAFYMSSDEPKDLGFPLMVKPALEGSSIGMYKVNAQEELTEAIRKAHQYDDNVLVEQWIDGPEYTVAILNDRALPAIRLETPNEFYDFDAKYRSDSTLYHCPSGLDEEEEAELQALALKAFRVVGASGWGRVDIMRDAQGNFQLLEINTVPGMTDHSLVPMAAKAIGLSFEGLVAEILLSARRAPQEGRRQGYAPQP